MLRLSKRSPDWPHSRPHTRRRQLVQERYMPLPSSFTVAVSVVVAIAGGSGYLVWQRTQTPQALFESGKNYYEQNNYQEARIQLTEALRKDPSHKEARLLLSRVFAETGNLQGAAAQLKALLAFYPDDPTVNLELSNIYRSWFE